MTVLCPPKPDAPAPSTPQAGAANIAAPTRAGPAPDYARNLRRLMARQGLTLGEVARRSGLNLRTIKALVRGRSRPHGRTLQRLAAGLAVPVDEFFQDPSLLAHRLFDRRTNPVVDQVVDNERQLFRGWSEAEFDDLYSRFGHGGPLTREGAIAVARAINRRRGVQQQVALLLETDAADLLVGIVELLYRRAQVLEPDR